LRAKGETDSSYQIKDTDKKTTLIRTSSVTTDNYDLGKGLIFTQKVENLQFDEFGNVKQKRITKTPGHGGDPKVVYETRTFINHKGSESTITPWLIGRVSSVEKCINAPGGSTSNYGNVISYKVFEYNNDYLHPLMIKSWFLNESGTVSWAVTENDYYGNGLLRSVTKPDNIQTLYTYDDAYHSFVEQLEIIPLADVSKKIVRTFETDPRYGKIIKSTNEYGLRVKIGLDEFGREISATTYEGASGENDGTLINKNTVQYFLSSNGESYIQKNTFYGDSLGNFISNRKYYDAFGRNYKSISSAVEGDTSENKYVAQYIKYDSLGRGYETSEPYYSGLDTSLPGAEIRWTTREYDGQGRVTKVTLADEIVKTIELQYNTDLSSDLVASKTVIQKNGLNDIADIEKQSFYNIDGKVNRIIEDKGGINVTSNYTYDPLGRLIKTTVAGKDTNITYYPGTDWQKTIDDPNAGLTTYTYFDVPGDQKFGLIESETRPDPNIDGETVTTTNEFNDFWGRLTRQVSPDRTIEFHYDNYDGFSGDPGTFGAGRLTWLTFTEDGNTLTKKYDYDIHGSTIKTTRDLGGAVFSTGSSAHMPSHVESSQEIDCLGRVTKMVNPDSTEVDYNYYGGSAVLKDIREGSTVYASYTDINKRAQIGSVKYGNDVKTTYTYHDNGLLDEMKTETDFLISTNKTYLHFNYDFYKNGNIKRIDDFIDFQSASGPIDLSIDYTYDGLNRLTSAVQNGETFNYEFDNNTGSVVGRGNLTKKRNRLLEYYPGSTKLQKSTNTTSGEITNFTWSASGNMLSKSSTLSSKSYEYNSENMLKKVTGDSSETTFYYDESGQRFLKIYNDYSGSKIKTYYFGNYEFRVTVTDGTVSEAKATKYVFGADGKLLTSLTSEASGLMAFNGIYGDVYEYGVFAGLFASDSILESIESYYNKFITSTSSELRLTMLLLLLLVPLFLFIYLRNILGLVFSFSQDDVKEKGVKCIIRFELGGRIFKFGIAGRGSGYITDYVAKNRFHGQAAFFSLMIAVAFFGCSQNYSSGIFSSSRSVTGNTMNGVPVGVHYYSSNHLGSSTLVTDENGNEVTRINYNPYGEIQQQYSGIYNQDTKYIDDAPDSVTLKFTGQEYDHESKLYYYNARYYDPEVGVFTSADSIVPDPFGSMSYNRHMYVEGNPVMFSDPTGHWSLSKLFYWNSKDDFNLFIFARQNNNGLNEIKIGLGPFAIGVSLGGQNGIGLTIQFPWPETDENGKQSFMTISLGAYYRPDINSFWAGGSITHGAIPESLGPPEGTFPDYVPPKPSGGSSSDASETASNPKSDSKGDNNSPFSQLDALQLSLDGLGMWSAPLKL